MVIMYGYSVRGMNNNFENMLGYFSQKYEFPIFQTLFYYVDQEAICILALRKWGDIMIDNIFTV